MPSPADSPPLRESNGRVLLEIAFVFAVFALQGGWPVPDVNEPCYLGKVKNYWDPAWASADFYFQTHDAHQVFNWTLGWLSLILPLPALAWIGRLATWWSLAWAWRRLSWSVAPRPWWAVVSAGLYVLLQERCQMAGEWVIGGFEAKGPAYVLVLLGLEALVKNRWPQAILLWGAASAFHVLVGGWTLVAAGWCWLWMGRERPGFLGLLPWLLLGALLALPGLWPALELNADVDPSVGRQAAEIYVVQRLPHHLEPYQFDRALVARHALLFAAFLLLCRLAPSDGGVRRLALAVGGAVALAAIGWAFATVLQGSSIYPSLMRYYWFRLSDALLPAGASLLCLAAIDRDSLLRPVSGRWWLGIAAGVAAFHLGGYALERPLPVRPRADKENKIADYVSWRQACDWVRDNTPPDALFITPRTQQTFKWHAGRGEVVTWKDLPQDAAGIVEWWRRIELLHRTRADEVPPATWRKSLVALGPDRLQRLGREFQATYLLTEAEPPLPLEILYRNASYAVYKLQAPGAPPAGNSQAGTRAAKEGNSHARL